MTEESKTCPFGKLRQALSNVEGSKTCGEPGRTIENLKSEGSAERAGESGRGD
jgi:hypothetical protein